MPIEDPKKARYYQVTSDPNAQFWVMNLLGWFGISLITYFSLSLPYNQFELSYLAHNVLQSSFMLAPPELLEQSIPVYWMIERYAPTLFLSIFVVMLLGTLIQTGAGLIQGFVERIESALTVKEDGIGLSVIPRTLLIIGVLVVSAAFSFLGIVALIGKGYSLLAVGFGLVYVLPLLLRGVQYFWVGEGKDLSSQQTGS